eukprot:14086011-Alexandrium_andersonii.AAC.1
MRPAPRSRPRPARCTGRTSRGAGPPQGAGAPWPPWAPRRPCTRGGGRPGRVPSSPAPART